MTETEIFKNSEVDETRRAHAIAIRIWSAVANQIKSELAFWSFDPAIGFANWRPKRADLHFWVHDWSRLNLCERLLQNLDALMHLESAHHQAIVSVAMIAERDPKFESRINSVT